MSKLLEWQEMTALTARIPCQSGRGHRRHWARHGGRGRDAAYSACYAMLPSAGMRRLSWPSWLSWRLYGGRSADPVLRCESSRIHQHAAPMSSLYELRYQ